MVKISGISALACATALASTVSALTNGTKLSASISVAPGVWDGKIDGHVQVLFAPAGTDPLEDTDVTSSPNLFFGKNVFDYGAGDSVTLSGGDGMDTDFGVWGWPNVSMEDIAPGEYSVQAFLNPYETVTRGDGSTISLRFPQGDGAPPVNGYGNPLTSLVNVTITGQAQTVELTFDNVTESEGFTGNEIGGDSQGNYEDTEFLKHVKIRSDVLSDWWGRDVYVGANVLVPFGYDASDKETRYPVLYSQGHWPGGNGALRYSTNPNISAAWDSGIVPATGQPTPKIIMVTFRHETPYYDDSYAVNTANIGPWGDAINDELIPYIEANFNTIAAPYARIQEGGSTGGWESAANLVYRPDLFGACFSSYPDSLSFTKHQDIALYTNKNAYVNDDGSDIYSIRELNDAGEEVLVTTVAQENHWELTHGTSTRSFLQWDVWNAVFGAQGLNGYPLEPWDKVTGEIYPEAVELWRPFDLADYVTSNWDNALDLGAVLKNRMFIYVGTADNYFLNEGVAEFQRIVEAKGGAGWANFTYIEGAEHGGNYQRLDTWVYLELVLQWVRDHAPNGKTPLSPAVTVPTSRGNKFADVIAHGGRDAALARQAAPTLEGKTATVGRWDPGVKLTAQWLVDGKAVGPAFGVKQGDSVTYTGGKSGKLQIAVTGTKRGYEEETRKSKALSCNSKRSRIERL